MQLTICRCIAHVAHVHYRYFTLTLLGGRKIRQTNIKYVFYPLYPPPSSRLLGYCRGAGGEWLHQGHLPPYCHRTPPCTLIGYHRHRHRHRRHRRHRHHHHHQASSLGFNLVHPFTSNQAPADSSACNLH